MDEVAYPTNSTDDWELDWAYCITCGHSWPVMHPNTLKLDTVTCLSCSPKHDQT